MEPANVDQVNVNVPPPPLQPAAPAQIAGGRDVKLPPFWESSPEAWFGLADAQFALRNVQDERLKFYHVLTALPETSVRGMQDLLRGVPPPDAYQLVRARLLANHALTEYQRMEKLLSRQPLGGQRPSDMLHELIQYCPEGESTTRIFRLLFLQRLPRELRIILAEDVLSTLPQLAARADHMWSHAAKQSHDPPTIAVAAASAQNEEEDPTVAAVGYQQSSRGGGRPRGSQNRGGGNRGAARGGSSAAPAATAAVKVTPSGLARQSSGLCRNHWMYGEKAFSCKAPCSWQGN